MYAWAVAHANGFEERGTVRSFDNKYYTKSAVVGAPSLREPYHNAEFAFLQSAAQHELKIPITGAYTLAVWSYDEHYAPAGRRLGVGTSRAGEVAARREFALDLARNVIRPNLQALIDLGATWIQIDEPGASTEEDELEVFVESFNASVEGLDCVFSTHLCFSDYDLFFPAIEGMSGCKQYCVGFANYDSRDLGTSAEDRPGYEVISRFRDLPYEPILGLGVLDIHTDFVEPPELVGGPHFVRRGGLRRSRPHPGLSGLRPAHAQLGDRLREAGKHGRGHAPGRDGAQPRPRRGAVAFRRPVWGGGILQDGKGAGIGVPISFWTSRCAPRSREGSASRPARTEPGTASSRRTRSRPSIAIASQSSP